MRKQLLLSGGLLAGVLGLGCASDPNAKPTTRMSDAAINDPFGKWSTMDESEMDISGGGTGDLRRDALRRDARRTLMLD